jgi:DNA-binding transcriptional MocR family regulator
MWVPQLDRSTGPVYQAIAEALRADIAEGRLSVGERLPTHRDLARRLGVTIGTVTRAYAEAERRGLTEATVGRGTFVKAPASAAKRAEPAADGIVDLRSNYPALAASAAALSETLIAMGRDAATGDLLRYHEHAGPARHRAAGARLISASGLPVTADRVLITAGGQHAIAVALLTLARAGDVILTEQLTYHNFKALAQRLGLRLHGVALDEEGLIPEAFEEACRKLSPRALYCTPTLQNPTAAIMSAERRARIAAIAAAHEVTLIEDDIFGFLAPEQRPLTAYAEGPACYLSSISKSLAPGLRLGFLVIPEGQSARYSDAIRITSWMAPPLAGEIVCRWIEDGTAQRLIAAQREEARARVKIAQARLGALLSPTHPTSSHVWLKLPAPLRADRFQQEALSAGVAVTTGEPFAVDGPAPEAIRLCLGPAATREILDKALGTLATLLHSARAAHEPALSIL